MAHVLNLKGPATTSQRLRAQSLPDLHHVHTSHVNGSGPEPRLGLFFEARRWIGEPTNREPDKCSAVRWFPLDALPGQLIDYPATGIHAYRDGRTFTVRGWNTRMIPAGTSA
ncbi:MAG: hypothetical protein ACRDTT_06525 [Pseudonocardiaceae bacterium]